ncbi:MAG: tetratricopeptide repeat protein [Candidatus Zipacnadales bacterium]
MSDHNAVRGSKECRGWQGGIRLIEAAIWAGLVGLAAYAAGVRNGIAIGERRTRSEWGSPAEHAERGKPPSETSESHTMPSIDVEELKARLVDLPVEELLAIGNEHLDRARSVSEGENSATVRNRFTIAVAAYERALELRPDDPDILTDLGVALRGCGDFEGAVRRFREAAEKDTQHPQSRFNLGVVLLYDLHRPKQAMEAWEEYLAIAPKDDPGRLQVEQELDRLRKR